MKNYSPTIDKYGENIDIDASGCTSGFPLAEGVITYEKGEIEGEWGLL